MNKTILYTKNKSISCKKWKKKNRDKNLKEKHQNSFKYVAAIKYIAFHFKKFFFLLHLVLVWHLGNQMQ